MTIRLIKREEYETLLNIQKNNPILTFENNGYEYIDESKFTNSDKDAFDTITSILKEAIVGFHKFNNFKISKKTKEISIRFQYDWSLNLNANGSEERSGIPFTGVGYLFIDELLYGFKDQSNVVHVNKKSYGNL